MDMGIPYRVCNVTDLDHTIWDVEGNIPFGLGEIEKEITTDQIMKYATSFEGVSKAEFVEKITPFITINTPLRTYLSKNSERVIGITRNPLGPELSEVLLGITSYSTVTFEVVNGLFTGNAHNGISKRELVKRIPNIANYDVVRVASDGHSEDRDTIRGLVDLGYTLLHTDLAFSPISIKSLYR